MIGELSSPAPESGDYFGFAVGISAESLLVGAPGQAPEWAGAVFSYSLSGGKLNPAGTLRGPSPRSRFGAFLAVEENQTLISAPGLSSNVEYLGSVLCFKRLQDEWDEHGRLIPLYGQSFAQFGQDFAWVGDRVIVGAPGFDGLSIADGIVYDFSISMDSQQYCTCGALNLPCGNSKELGGCVNSTGYGATLGAGGSASATVDDLRLQAAWLPADVESLFLMAATSNDLPFGDGLLCLGGETSAIYRFPPMTSRSDGIVEIGPGIVGMTHSSFPPLSQIKAGDTWYFQTWYRDPNGPCGAGFNLTNGLKVEFTP